MWNLSVVLVLLIIFSETVTNSKNVDINNGTIRLSESGFGESSSIKQKLSVPKCCKKDEIVKPVRITYQNKVTRIVQTCVKHTDKLNFSFIPLYDNNLSPTGRAFLDVYDFKPEGKFYNETFKSITYDFSRTNHRTYLTENEVLYRELPNEMKRWYVYNKSDFCIDYLLTKTKGPVVYFWSVVDQKPARSFLQQHMLASCLLISCIFLFFTILVYILLPELRNLGGLILMAYMFSLFNAFLLLAILKLSQFYKTGCKAMTYITYFFFLSSFAWMNIMSCDIWWTFRGYAKARPIHRRGEPFKFMIYCLYGFGVPLLMTVVMAAIDNSNMSHVPWFVIPNISSHGCFLGEGPRLLYLYVPMFIMIICNWLFFLLTAFNIWRLYRSTKVLDTISASCAPTTQRKQKDRLLIYLKLSIIMGINWLLEVISSFQPEEKWWYVSDIYNILVGLSIFLIFVCKRKIFEKVVRRCRRFPKYVTGWRRSQYSTSHSISQPTAESDDIKEMPLVCISPKGPDF